MIELKNFSIGYGSRMLLDGVDASFVRGELCALIGRNGSGKSTLLRAMAGLGAGYSGHLLVEGEELSKLPPHRLARKIAFVSTSRARIASMKCRDVVAAGRSPYTDWIGNMSDDDHRAVDHALSSVGMTDYASRPIDTLSDGECQRIMIARALAQDTPVILLDEPTSFLDIPNRYELVSLLSHLAHEGDKCILFSTHELDVARQKADTIALIDSGSLIHLPVPEMTVRGHIERLFHIPHPQ